MPEPTAQRTLVKSPPELWAEVSDAAALAKHLGAFGEIRITRMEPETTVAWEGERASGTVQLEPAGWGTKVTLTASVEEPEPQAVEPVAVEPEPVTPGPEPGEWAEPAVPAGRRAGFFARLFRSRQARHVAEMPTPPPSPAPVEPVPDPEPEPEPEPAPQPIPQRDPEPEPEPPAAAIAEGPDPVAILTEVLDNLGSAHHRPFSRP